MWIFYSHFYRLFAYIRNKYYLQVYLHNCADKVVNKQMIDYLDENRFEG